jgi:hypothetical protein
MTRWVIIPEKVFTSYLGNITKTKADGKRFITGILDETTGKRKAKLGRKVKNKKIKYTKKETEAIGPRGTLTTGDEQANSNPNPNRSTKSSSESTSESSSGSFASDTNSSSPHSSDSGF